MTVSLSSDNPFVGFGCGGYRAFCGPDTARMGPFDRVQVVAGQNNSGKSSLIDYFIKMVDAIDQRGRIQRENDPLVRADSPLSLKSTNDWPSPAISFCIRTDSLEEKLLHSASSESRRMYVEELISLFRGAPYAVEGGDAAWIDFNFERGRGSSGYNDGLRADFVQYKTSGASMNLTDASLTMCSHAGGEESNYANLVSAAIPWEMLPKFLKVGAIRSIVDSDTSERGDEINGGIGLPSSLLRLSNPERKDFELSRHRWNKLEGFVRDVLNDQSASILVSHDSHEISVKTNDTDYLPLESLGTGLTELIILASVVACNTNRVICIEEPEIHLHPSLQARLMGFLLSDESNRFIVTTHSPTIINTFGVQIAHVTKANGISTCRQLDGVVVARGLLDDLGARASDLLQSNYIIWVEGPSDRIYVNYWIVKWSEANGIKLVEGIHYSVMLYGGKLLNALDAGPDCTDAKLIALFRINTHFCVLMDSDRKTRNARLGSTKERVIRECKASDALSWVTWGSTIENYVPADNLRDAIKAIHPGKKWKYELDERYTCPLSFKFIGKQSALPNKIAIAKAVCKAGFEPLGDCAKQVAKLCNAICTANGIFRDGF